VCTTAEDRLVCPDMKRPLDPGGMFKRIPGLSIIKSIVVTIRSVFVRTIPIAWEMRENARKNTSA